MHRGRTLKGLLAMAPVVVGGTIAGLCLLPVERHENLSRLTVGLKRLMLRHVRLPDAIRKKFRADLDAENFFP